MELAKRMSIDNPAAVAVSHAVATACVRYTQRQYHAQRLAAAARILASE